MPGKDNHVADALSRAEVSQLCVGVDYEAMAVSQANDSDVQNYPTAVTGLKLEWIFSDSTLLPVDMS